MYDNVGTKIKNLAIGTFVAEMIASIIGGILLMVEVSIAIGLVALFLGIIVAWISSCILYGFGEIIVETSSVKQELIELNQIITKEIEKEAKKAKAQTIKKIHPKVENASYYCKQCGNPGPYDGLCPECGSEEVTLFHPKA